MYEENFESSVDSYLKFLKNIENDLQKFLLSREELLMGFVGTETVEELGVAKNFVFNGETVLPEGYFFKMFGVH